MPVSGIDHLNIRTRDIAASAQFYADILDFEFRPKTPDQPGNWLLDDRGNAIIHLRLLDPDGPATGPLDHVALNCTGKAMILDRLRARDIDHQVVEGLTPGLTQVYLKDPHGVWLELYFDGD